MKTKEATKTDQTDRAVTTSILQHHQFKEFK